MLVVGLGQSGRAAARLLLDRGAKVVLNDAREELEGLEALVDAGAELELGHHDEALFTGVDRVVVSPGVPPLPALEAAEGAGVPIASEVELASGFVDPGATLVAITGTNGKSTVTSLLGAMAEHDPRPSFVGGNLGTPLVDVVGTPAAEAGGLVIVEVSSFQLERVDRFRAHVAVLLNVTEDHLDRYDSFAAYAAAKGNLFRGQRREDHAVVPAGDALCEGLAQAGAATLHRFGGDTGEVGFSKELVDAAGSYYTARTPRLNDRVSGLAIGLDEIHLRGGHNLANAQAAMLAGRLAGMRPETIRAGLAAFRGLPHRMELVRERGGVRFFDDSKATNVGAAVAGLEGFAHDAGKVVWIAGGKDKGGSYAPLEAPLRAVGRAAVTLGEAAERIEGALEGALEGVCPIVRVGTMEEAVAKAAELAEPGDAVVLAPACSSFDMFRSYAERGDVFQAAVNALKEAG
ncbi:MAG: UDP-N-acetylmuramoyl-L-alanine--D-glutamate ligase [Sandaracinus sp.]|nr:UDP-N-acetylmuramoyl-L-alanine--D-glutamate ligase [Sandaracinus sp.]MBJ73605.1 UDP-N-acetylmuramoyl-L-alanine--D-glutamate ligase [Sandaracinus sp.]